MEFLKTNENLIGSRSVLARSKKLEEKGLCGHNIDPRRLSFFKGRINIFLRFLSALCLFVLPIFSSIAAHDAQNSKSQETFNVGVTIRDGKFNTHGVHDPVDSAEVTIKDFIDTARVFSGYTNSSGFCQIPVTTTSTVAEEGNEAEISGFELGQNYPNPFNPSTIFPYKLGKSGKVKITIYNIRGQKVRVLVDGFQERGSYSAKWDGRDDNGEATASGVYFYVLLTNNLKDSGKMVKIDHGCEDASENSIINSQSRMNNLRANKNSKTEFSNMFEIKAEKENYSFESDTVIITVMVKHKIDFLTVPD